MKLVKVLLSLICVAVLLATPLSAQAIGFEAEEAYNSVFVIYSGNALGSGFALGKDCIVTNAHVISDETEVIVRDYNGQQYSAQVVGINEEQDIAVLGIWNVEFDYLTIANDSEMSIGDDIYAIGAPKSMAYTLTKGVISAKEREISRYTYIQIDAAINEGNSGGPLLNDVGQVVGMNTLKMSDSEGIGLAIPISRVCEYLKTLGIELDSAGNVMGTISASAGNADTQIETHDNPKQEGNGEKQETKEFPISAKISFWIAGISVLINIILVIALVYQRKKNLSIKYDPRERTDFDIDILE